MPLPKFNTLMPRLAPELMPWLCRKESSAFDTTQIGGDKWLELVQTSYQLNGQNESYTYMHEVRCNGAIVVVVPFITKEDGHTEFAVREEFTLAWGGKRISAMTGGVERPCFDSPALLYVSCVLDALRELREEAGFRVVEPYERILPLGQCFGVKSVDTVYNLFGVNVTGLTQGEASGDGSQSDKADVVWFDSSSPELLKIFDPVGITAIVRLKFILGL